MHPSQTRSKSIAQRGPTLIFLALSLSAVFANCRDSRVEYTALGDIQGDWVFAVKIDDTKNKPVLVHADARALAKQSSGALLRFEFRPDQENAHLIGINRSDILAVVVGVDATRIDEMQIRIKTVDEAPSKNHLAINFPVSSHYYEFKQDKNRFELASDTQRNALRQLFELIVPINLDHCRREDRETLTRFIRSNEIDCDQRYGRLFHVDKNRFVGITTKGAHLYYQDKENDCSVFSATISNPRLAVFYGASFDVALGQTPITGPSEATYLLAAISEEYNKPRGEQGRLLTGYRIETTLLKPDGFDQPSQISHYDAGYFPTNLSSKCPLGAAENTAEVEDIIIDHENRIIIVFDDGSLLTRAWGDNAFRYHAICDYAQYATAWLLNLEHLNSRPEGRFRHLVGANGSDGFAYLMNLDQEDAEAFKAYVDPGQALEFDASAFDGFDEVPGFVVVANSKTHGIILKQYADETGFAEWKVKYSDRIRACLRDNRFSRFRKIAVDEHAIYLLPYCNTVIRIRKRDRCASFIKVPDFQGFDPDFDELRDLFVQNEHLIVSGKAGVLYQFDLKNIDGGE